MTSFLTPIAEMFRTKMPWQISQSVRDLTDIIYNEYKLSFKPKCFVCRKTFENPYIRDFHINMIHCMGLNYTCYSCERYDLDDETEEPYFPNIIDLHEYRRVVHQEEGYAYSAIIL